MLFLFWDWGIFYWNDSFPYHKKDNRRKMINVNLENSRKFLTKIFYSPPVFIVIVILIFAFYSLINNAPPEIEITGSSAFLVGRLNSKHLKSF